MKTRLEWIDREDVDFGYFRTLSSVSDLASLELSWDDGLTWETLPRVQDQGSVREYYCVVRGPAADSTAGKLLALGANPYIVRVVDTPRIKNLRGSIEVR